MSHFQKKYLKYKSKYLQLKNIKYNQSGGDLPFINNVNAFNLFTDPDMEQYMNPIHGLVLCHTGYLSNIYWLHDAKLYDIKKQGKIITKVCNDIPGTLKPTNNLMNLKPIDYGRFIAIKYINMIQKKYNLITDPAKFNIDCSTIELLEKYINTVNNKETYFTINNNDITIFHLILYCLCWVANNDDGIEEYYKGIVEIYCLLGKFPTIYLPQLVLKKQEKKIVLKKL